jgi:hypothetical protein
MVIFININRSPHYASPEIVNVSIEQVIIKRENDQQKERKLGNTLRWFSLRHLVMWHHFICTIKRSITF